MNHQSIKGTNIIYFLMLLVPLFWGGAFGAAKHVISEIHPITAATLRFGSASLILLAIILFRSEWDMNILKRRWLGLLAMAITGIFSYNAFFFIALNYTSAINGSLIMATSPVYGLIGRVVMRGVSPLFTTTVTMLIGSVFLAIWSFYEGGWSEVTDMSGQSWIEMIYMSLFATVIAFFLWNKGVHQIGASKASIYMNLVPINATWIAVLFYGSTISWQQLTGMGFVITGVYIVTFGSRWKKTMTKSIEKPI